MSVDIDQCVADILDIGHCVVPNHFPKPAIDAFREGFLPLLAQVAARIPEGNRRANRWAIGLPFAPPFYQSAFFGDDTVNEIVGRILGESMFIAYYGTDTPVAGSVNQQVHSDIRPLFPEQPDLRYPPPTLSVRFTSVDMTLDNGPYSTSERTQHLTRDEAQAMLAAGEIELAPLLLRAGDVLISDARTLHRGTANRTDAPRPFAVIVYNRDWYHLEGEMRLEANEATPMLLESFYQSLPPAERNLLRRVPRTDG